jgi:hypothetical protein
MKSIYQLPNLQYQILMPPKKHRLFGEKGVLDRRELSTHRKSDAMYPQP